MSLSLNPDVEQMVQERVASGRFRSADEVVEAGLRLLDELDEIKCITDEELKAAVQLGLQQARDGRVRPLDASLLDEVKSRGRERLAREQAAGAG